MTGELVAAVLALALLTVLPGPDVAVVTRVALVQGRPAGVRAAAGVVTGLAVWGAATAAGLAALLAASATAYTVVRLAGAAYLVWLGLTTLWRRTPRADTAPTTARRPFVTGLLGNVLNPKIAVFYTGLLPGLVPDDAPYGVTLGALVAVHAALSLGWLVACATVLPKAARRARRVLDRVTGLALVGLGVAAAVRR